MQISCRLHWGFGAGARGGWLVRYLGIWVNKGRPLADVLDCGIAVDSQYFIVIDLDGLLETSLDLSGQVNH